MLNQIFHRQHLYYMRYIFHHCTYSDLIILALRACFVNKCLRTLFFWQGYVCKTLIVVEYSFLDVVLSFYNEYNEDVRRCVNCKVLMQIRNFWSVNIRLYRSAQRRFLKGLEYVYKNFQIIHFCLIYIYVIHEIFAK